MKIEFLGTSSAVPTIERNVTCTAFHLDSGAVWLFDCGEGTQHRIQKSTVRRGRIQKIFITHLHGDHCFGLPGLLCTLSSVGVDTAYQCQLFGPMGIGALVRTILKLSDSYLSYPVEIHEIVPPNKTDEDIAEYQSQTVLMPGELPPKFIKMDPSTKDYAIYKDSEISVVAAEMRHRVFCVGYCINEANRPGRLNVDECKRRGLTDPRAFGQFKKGQSVQAPDGTLVRPEEVLSPDRPGRKVVILGDTFDSSAISRVAQGADVIVHESTYHDELREKAIDHGHSTARMAGEFASSIDCKQLILTHFSNRYRNAEPQSEEKSAEGAEKEDNADDQAAATTITIENLVEEAKSVFSGDVFAAHDFFVFEVPLKH